jgi:hypothetical protein
MAKLFLVTIFSISRLFCLSQTLSPIDSAKNPINFLKSFYIIYITNIGIGKSLHSSDSLIKIYCTPRLLNKIAEHSDPEKLNWWDFDPFTKAQDYDTAVLKTLSVRKYKTETNSYSVSYDWTDYLSKITTKTTIHLIVKKQKYGFKIADVW